MSVPLSRNRDFLKLWSAQTISVTGSLLGALQFTAILALDATPSQMSLLVAAGVLPGLIFGLAVGGWVDRLRRRPVLIAADGFRAALLASVPAAWYLHVLRIEQVYTVAFFHGLLTMMFEVAYRSYLPSLVRPNQLVAANSRLSATSSVAEVGAFSLGGWIAQLVSSIAVVIVDAFTYLVSAGILFWIRAAEPEPAPPVGRYDLRRDVMVGLRFIGGNAVIRAIVVIKIGFGAGSGIIGSLIVLYGIDTLGFAPGVLGSIFAVGGVLSVLGAVATGRLTRQYGLGRTLVAGIIAYGLGAFLIPLARGPLLLAGAYLVAQQLFDFGSSVYEITEVSVRQMATPPEMLGRVNAAMEATERAALLIGALAAGLLADAFGLRGALAVGAGVMAAGGIWGWFTPLRSVVNGDLSSQTDLSANR